ncbi:diaminopimelate epimerase [Ulvibacter antarcticus]|uniref:Diaminopimelate epimerase n=1 Tax=Ulvibacter antarcticus TaxID=442714 RepID=A0A3L9YX60_9FLAO|nr:diaminopimelate epimerase [Ulvibacter antarcticus]RMA64924.1 diaminopimelate epimerase [Ulvibacter antarcticus]
MEIPFFKYQGTGNDFVMIDNRQGIFIKNNTELVAKICDRRFGIGADGLILLENHPDLDFNMVYYNSDGNLSSMCGNGGRCISQFAKQLGIVDITAKFEAVDGLHEASIQGMNVSLKMADVSRISLSENCTFLDTGSPHHVQIVSQLDTFDVDYEGANIRNSIYGKEGANVNFVQALGNDIFSVRTYERGVEAETLSCGTGVTAVALAMFETGKTTSNKVTLQTPGGVLTVRFKKQATGFTDIYLEGPASFVFKGIWTC